jgi:hypothetical protein
MTLSDDCWQFLESFKPHATNIVNRFGVYPSHPDIDVGLTRLVYTDITAYPKKMRAEEHEESPTIIAKSVAALSLSVVES